VTRSTAGFGLKPDQSVNFTWFGLDRSVSLCIVLLRQMASRPDGDPHGAACVDRLSTSTHCTSSHLHTTAISAIAAYSPSVSACPDMVLSPMLHQSAWYIRPIKASTSSSRSPVPLSHPLPHAVQESLLASDFSIAWQIEGVMRPSMLMTNVQKGGSRRPPRRD
jgi:hypothetical protein